MTGAARTQKYTIEEFTADVQSIMGSGENRAAIMDKMRPLLQRLLREDDLLEERFKVDLGEGRYTHSFYRSPDGSLSISAPVFSPGRPTLVHDHLTWGLIGVYTGEQKTTRYRRTDDGSQPGRANLELLEEEVYTRGAIYSMIPPDDIHRIETVGEEPGVSIHVLGTDFRRQKRHVYDPEEGTVQEVEGMIMMT
jgi:predicted metal-dependent enzyme (double-stranded beta helix superfamily)